MEVKNFNDLVARRSINEVTPLLLIVIVLPMNLNDWIDENDARFIINAQKYWYYPDENTNFSSNRRTIRVEIPIDNQLTTATIAEIFNRFHN